MPSSPEYDNIRDYLAARFPNIDAVRTFVCAPPIGLKEEDFPRTGSVRDLWHGVLKLAEQKRVFDILIAQVIQRFSWDEALIVRADDDWKGGRVEEPAKIDLSNPYPGLQAFERADRENFFGRESSLSEVLEGLQRPEVGIFTLYGGSGSGKSSLLRAGVALDWETAKGKALLLTPGSDPFASLLAMALGNRYSEEEAFIDAARAGKCDDLLTKLQAAHFHEHRLLLIVDQGEQLFTRTTDRVQRERFLRCLFHDGGPTVRVLVGIRDDYFPVWSQTLPIHRSHTTVLRPPTKDEYRAIILGPAGQRRVLVEERLCAEILEQVRDRRGALPLLQFLLHRLWEKGDPATGILSRKTYDDLGGVEGALRLHIAAFLRKYPNRDAEMRQLLLSLVRFEVRENKYSAFARSCPMSALADDLRKALLSDAWRLLTTSPQPGYVEFSHEAVLSNWPGFDHLAQRYGETLARRSDVVEDSNLYLCADRAEKARLLWTGARLDAAMRLAGLGPYVEAREDDFSLSGYPLNADQRNFLQAAYRRQQSEQRWKRLAVLALGVLTVVACGLAAWAVNAQQDAAWGLEEARRAYHTAETEKTGAQEQLLLSTRKAWGAARQALDANPPDPAAGLARLAEAVRYNNALPGTMRLHSLDVDAAQTLLRLPNLGQPARPPLRHGAGVNTASFSPDGKWIVTASDDGTARVWDAATGNPLTEPMRHQMPVTRAIFSPDGKRVLTISGGRLDETDRRVPTGSDGKLIGGQVRLWDAVSGNAVHNPLRAGKGFVSANFSPDGTWVVAVDKGGEVIPWNIDKGEETRLAHRLPEGSMWAGFSPDGKSVALIDSAGQLWVVDWPTGKLRIKSESPDLYSELYPFAPDEYPTGDFSPDGKQVLVKNLNRTSQVQSTESGFLVSPTLKYKASLNSARFSPDGSRVITACGDGTAQIWDAPSGTPVGKQLLHHAAVRTAVFSPDGRRVVTASADGTARVWIAATGEPAGEPMHHIGGVDCAEFSPDGRRVVTASRDGTAQVWEASSGVAGGTPFWLGDWVIDATFNRRGNRVLTAGFGHRAQVWDAATGKTVGLPMEHDEAIRRANFSPDGTLVVTASEDETAQVWDAATGRGIGNRLALGGLGRTASFSPDGKRVVTGADVRGAHWSGTASTWDAATGLAAGPPMPHPNPVLEAMFSPDGKMVVTVALDAVARTWDAASGQPRRELHDPTQPEARVARATFSPNSRWMLLLTEKAVIVDASSGRLIGQPMSSGASIGAARFSPDGVCVATSDAAGVAQVWTAQTGEKRGGPLRHAAPVESAEFSPDCLQLVTVSGAGNGSGDTVKVWDLDNGRVIGMPFRCEEFVKNAHFSPDRRWILTSGSWDAARLWEVGAGVRGPGFADALEAFAGKRVDANGQIEIVPVAKRMDTRARLWPENNGDFFEDFARLLHWRFAEAVGRRLSPNSPLTVSEYIDREIDGVMNHSPLASEDAQEVARRAKNLAILESAYALDPGHPLIHFALAAYERTPPVADFERDFGLKYLPDDARVCATAAQILLTGGDLPRAVIAAEKALALDPQNADALKVKARASRP